MIMRKLFVQLGCMAVAFFCLHAEAAVSNFTCPDANPYSPRYGEDVGPYDALNSGAVTLWYTSRAN